MTEQIETRNCDYWTDSIPSGAVSAQRWYCQLDSGHEGQHKMGLVKPETRPQMTNEQIIAALKKSWEEDGAKTIFVDENAQTFSASDFIESLSYSNRKTPG